jgi:hypothetical protein
MASSLIIIPYPSATTSSSSTNITDFLLSQNNQDSGGDEDSYCNYSVTTTTTSLNTISITSPFPILQQILKERMIECMMIFTLTMLSIGRSME